MLTSAMCPHGNNTRDDSNILFYISLYSLEPNESTTNDSDPAHHGHDNNYYLGCVIYKKRKHVILDWMCFGIKNPFRIHLSIYKRYCKCVRVVI